MHPMWKTPCTKKKSKAIHKTTGIYENKSFSLGTTLLRLGECLLPDRPCSLLVETGEEDVKHLGVPVHWVAFDALLDVLGKS